MIPRPGGQTDPRGCPRRRVLKPGHTPAPPCSEDRGRPRRLGAAVAPCLRERTKEAAQLFFRVRSLHQGGHRTERLRSPDRGRLMD